MTGGMAIPMTAAMAITTTTEAGPVMDRDARRLRGQQPRIVTKPKEDKGMAESAASRRRVASRGGSTAA
jgi:hypothetical protein